MKKNLFIACVSLLFFCFQFKSSVTSLPKPSISKDSAIVPLIVIDNIKWINPYQVKSITLYKDSAAIAKYGAAGINGVIVFEMLNTPLAQENKKKR